MLKHEDYVIEQIDRLDVEQQRRVAVLFEDYCSADRGLQAMGLVSLHYFAKRAQGAALTLPVVRHVAEIALHLRGLTQRLDYLPLSLSKRFFAGPCAHRARALADGLWKGKG